MLHMYRLNETTVQSGVHAYRIPRASHHVSGRKRPGFQLGLSDDEVTSNNPGEGPLVRPLAPTPTDARTSARVRGWRPLFAGSRQWGGLCLGNHLLGGAERVSTGTDTDCDGLAVQIHDWNHHTVLNTDILWRLRARSYASET